MSAAFSASANRVSANLAQKVAASENEIAPGAAAKGKDAPGLLQYAARGIGWMIEREKEISALFASVPYPGQPAARYFDLHFGMPHGHMHKPTMGAPLPSIGPLLYIPYVSGATKVTINNQVAMRCGDFGLSAWCGSYMPMNEIFFGSATVWIESARAARSNDITDHCVLFDPPMLGVAKGYVTNGSGDVKIGGMPMPSLTQAAIGLAMKPVMKQLGKAAKKGARAAKPLFKGLTKASQRLQAKTLARFLAHVEIVGTAAFKREVVEDLAKMAQTKVGCKMMNEAVDNGKRLAIKPTSALADIFDIPYPKERPFSPKSWFNDGPCVWADDLSPGGWGKKTPTGSTIYYDPGKYSDLGHGIGSASSDTILVHELSHANNMGAGRYNDTPFTDLKRYDKWKNPDEEQAVKMENLYRDQTGQPSRDRYWYSKPPRVLDNKVVDNY